MYKIYRIEIYMQSSIIHQDIFGGLFGFPSSMRDWAKTRAHHSAKAFTQAIKKNLLARNALNF